MPDTPSVSSIEMALLEEVRRNATSFFLSTALLIDIKYKNTKNIHTLIDSGTSENFMDSQFALNNSVPLQNLKEPLCLTLFDGSASSDGLIVQPVTLNGESPCGAQHSVLFLQVLLDHSATAVLGY
jgi:hypothetical protein